MPEAQPSNRIVTIPNALSLLRLLLVPVFVWLILVPQADVAALVVLMVSGATDWLDGWLARALNQTSRLGQLLDPIADRLFIVATVVTLAIRDIIPWWIVGLLVLRDVVMLAVQLVVRNAGLPILEVSLFGKAATTCLLYAFPLLLLTVGTGSLAAVAQPVAWALCWWGIGLYWWAAIDYVVTARTQLRSPVYPRA